MIALVTGPVRSGKSERATILARERAPDERIVLVVTAAVDPADTEMTARVARHRADRPAAWRVVETAAPGAAGLPATIAGAAPGDVLIVDALGTWVAALMLRDEVAFEHDAAPALHALEAQIATLHDALDATAAEVIVVAEAVGWDVVPPSAQGRAFRDAMGRATRAIAARAGHVELVVAGIPLVLTAGPVSRSTLAARETKHSS